MTNASASSVASEAPRPSKRPKGPKGIDIPTDRPGSKCARCLAPRGSKTKDWTEVYWEKKPVAWLCPNCPKQHEPIRRVITSKGDARWRYTVTVTPKGTHRAVQKTGTAATLEEARAQVAAIRQEIKTTGTYAKPDRLTVGQLAERWVAAKQKDVDAGSLRQVTLTAGYQSSLRSVCLHIGQHEAEHVTPADIRDLLTALKTKGGMRGKPLGKASLGMALLSLRMIFDWALEQKWVASNPTLNVTVPKVADNDLARRRGEGPKVWTVEEYRRFRDHLDEVYATGTTEASRDPWVRAGLRLTLCGLRRSEVLGMDWRSVDLAAGTVAIVASRTNTGEGSKTQLAGPKSKESRRLVAVEAIAPGTRSALRELWVAQGQPSEGLVVLDNLGRPVAPDTFSRRFWTLSESADVPRISVHNLRHTLASALHEAGVAPVEGASMLGHAVATHIQFYVPVSNEAGAAGASKAGAIFAQEA